MSLDTEEELELRFLGPLLNVTRVEDHLPLLANVFGLEARAIQELDESEVEALWGISGRSAGTVLLETGESRTGVRLVQFEPQVPTSPRQRERARRVNPLQGLEFLTGNFEIARNTVERAGYSFRSVARYSLSGSGRFTEGLIDGPDGVAVTVVRMHDRPMEGLVRLPERLFGELLSVITSAAEVEPLGAFYRLIGLADMSDPEDHGPPVSGEAHRSGGPRYGVQYGSNAQAPSITIVHDELAFVPPVATLDQLLVEQHGCVALRFQANSVERIRARIRSEEGRRLGARILDSGRGILQPMGAVESLLVRSPNGVVHQFLGRL